jgi:mRNA interferase MazF
VDRGSARRGAGLRRGDVYWVDFDPARGGEIRERRPAVIVSNETSNRIVNRVQVVPLTSNVSRVYPPEALVRLNGEPCKAMADQIRTVAKERVLDQIGSLSRPDLLAVEQAIRLQLGLS